MTPTTRLTVLGLGVAAVAFAAATTVMPTHVTFGAGSLRCGTVLSPDRHSEIGRFCAKAGAHQLHEAEAVAGVVAIVALVPMVAGRRNQLRWRGRWGFAWLVLVVCLAIAGVASLGLSEYSPPRGPTFQL